MFRAKPAWRRRYQPARFGLLRRGSILLTSMRRNLGSLGFLLTAAAVAGECSGEGVDCVLFVCAENGKGRRRRRIMEGATEKNQLPLTKSRAANLQRK